MPPGSLDPGLEPAEKSWLEHLRRIDVSTMPRTIRESLPDWLDEKLSALPDSDALIAALNQPAPLDIRVNPLKISRDDMLAAFAAGPAARFEPQPTPYSPWGIRFQGRPSVARWPAFEKGEIEVQDEGSTIPVTLMAPRRGERSSDLRDRPGVKS